MTNRALPATTRIAIATIVLRYRSARREHRRIADALDAGHVHAIVADARRNELWNTLQSMRTNVQDEIAGDRVSLGDAHDFVRHVARKAALQRRVALRAA